MLDCIVVRMQISKVNREKGFWTSLKIDLTVFVFFFSDVLFFLIINMLHLCFLYSIPIFLIQFA